MNPADQPEPKTQQEIIDFVTAPKTIAKVVEGSMDKRLKVLESQPDAPAEVGLRKKLTHQSGGDELLKGLADIIGCEWSSDENGFEGYDWFYVEPETGARFAMGEGANQLAELKNFVQAHTDAAVREAENIARLAEQANTRADTNGNVWYRADIDSGTEVTQLERIDQLLAESDSDYATFLDRLTKGGN